MELMIGFVIALAMLAAEDGWLGQDSERAWVNRLAEIAEATGNHLNRTVAVLVDTILWSYGSG